jgi:3-deoxy-7-phosphoheptulonate synthase
VDGAHVEFLSGIANPVGVKCGPSMSPDELLQLCDQLDAANEPGRLTLIVRHGAETIGRGLPPLMRAVREAGRRPLWVSDPMHGNTLRGGPRKLRPLPPMTLELRSFAAIAEAEGVWAGGLHLEMTPDDVLECGEEPGRWTSACDPRLNRDQARDLVSAFAASIAQRVAA